MLESSPGFEPGMTWVAARRLSNLATSSWLWQETEESNPAADRVWSPVRFPERLPFLSPVCFHGPRGRTQAARGGLSPRRESNPTLRRTKAASQPCGPRGHPRSQRRRRRAVLIETCSTGQTAPRLLGALVAPRERGLTNKVRRWHSPGTSRRWTGGLPAPPTGGRCWTRTG